MFKKKKEHHVQKQVSHKHIYDFFFFCLRQVLAVACEVFVAACGFLSYGMQTS